MTPTEEIIEKAAAVSLLQPLQSALKEEAGYRLYPPTFPNIEGYFIDSLPDESNRCIVDSKQSQSRRLAKKLIEINNAQPEHARFLPDVSVSGNAASRRIGEVGHRVADAAVLLAGDVGKRASEAMKAYNQGDATALGTLFPESLLFGFWDSHTLPNHKPTQAKRSRILHSEIHAYGISPVRAKSVYVASAPVLMAMEDYDADKADEKLSEAGLANAIGNNSRAGVVAKTIARSAEINLAALRQIFCRTDGAVDEARTRALRAYLFHLALLAAAWPESDELNLRSGCLLIPLPKAAAWTVLMRDGATKSFQPGDDLLTETVRAAQQWFRGTKLPSLTAGIGKAEVVAVRESLRGKGKKKTVADADGSEE